MNEESSKFIAEKKSEIAEDGIDGLGKENDIMTVLCETIIPNYKFATNDSLVRANLLEGKDKLSDRELIAQLPFVILVFCRRARIESRLVEPYFFLDLKQLLRLSAGFYIYFPKIQNCRPD